MSRKQLSQVLRSKIDVIIGCDAISPVIFTSLISVAATLSQNI